MWARTHLSAIQSITYEFVFIGWLHTSSYVQTRMCEFVPWLITHGFVCVNSYVWIPTMPDYTRVRMYEFACVNLYHACLHTSSYVWIRTMPILCYGRHERLRLCTVRCTVSLTNLWWLIQMRHLIGKYISKIFNIWIFWWLLFFFIKIFTSWIFYTSSKKSNYEYFAKSYF